MTSNSQIKDYASELANALRSIASAQQEIKDIVGSARDAGIAPKVLRKVARELIMESDKRRKLYEEEDQLDMFRQACGLTSTSMLEAAE